MQQPLDPVSRSRIELHKASLSGKLTELLTHLDIPLAKLQEEMDKLNQNWDSNDSDQVELTEKTNEACEIKEKIDKIEGYLQHGVTPQDYDGEILKSLKISRSTPNASPDLKQHQRLAYERQVSLNITDQQKKQKLIALYDICQTDYESNLKALDKFEGDLEKARKYLIQGSPRGTPTMTPTISDQMKQEDETPSLRIYEWNEDIQRNESKLKEALRSEELSIIEIVDEILDLQQKLTNCSQKLEKTYQKQLDSLMIIVKLHQQIQQAKIDIIMQDLELADEKLTQNDILELLQGQQESYNQSVQKKASQARIQAIQTKISKYQLLLQEYIKNELTEKIFYDQQNNGQNNQTVLTDLNEKNNNERSAQSIDLNTNSLEDLKLKWSSLSIQQITQLLTSLFQSKKISEYHQLLIADKTLTDLPYFKEFYQEMASYNQDAQFNRLTSRLFNKYQKGGWEEKHVCVKIYLSFDQQNIENPAIISDVLIDLNKIQPPNSCKYNHDDIKECVSNVQNQQLLQNYQIIKRKGPETQQYSEDLYQALAKLTQFQQAFQEIKRNQDLAEYFLQIISQGKFSETFMNLPVLRDLKDSIVCFKSAIEIASNFRILHQNVINESPSISKSLQPQLIFLHQTIKKYLPDFEKGFEEEILHVSFAPQIINHQVQELFMLGNNQIEGQTQKLALKSLLEQIFFEDMAYYKQLSNFICQTEKYKESLQPLLATIMSKSEKSKNDLQAAFNQIDEKTIQPQTIRDFITIDVEKHIATLQSQLCTEFKQNGVMTGTHLQALLYDLIKKRCSFDEFIKALSQVTDQNKEMLLTNNTLINYLLKNADTFLKTMLLSSCSQYMPVPLVSFQARIVKTQINQDEEEKKEGEDIIPPSISYEPILYEELFYTWEKYKSVLCFKISSNENKSPQGCSSMANMIFSKSFQLHSKSMVNYGSIEIQFDYNFEHPMFVPVADAQGLVNLDILERVYDLFDIFMIHTQKGNDSLLQDQIRLIQQKVPDNQIFVIIHDEDLKESAFSSRIEGKIIYIQISNYEKLFIKEKDLLKTFVLEQYFKYLGDFQVYEDSEQKRLNSLEQFVKVAEKFNKKQEESKIEFEPQETTQGFLDYPQPSLSKAVALIKNFLNEIQLNKENFHTEQFLPMNYYFKKACSIEKQLVHDAYQTVEQCEVNREKVADIYKKIKQGSPSPMTKQLEMIKEHGNYFGITAIISKLIKSIVNQQIKPLIQQRTQINTQMQQKGINENQKDALLQQQEVLTNEIEKKQYSNEYLYREHYIYEMSQIRDSTDMINNINNGINSFEQYLALANLQIAQGQPFEIIDGNNLQFIKDIYEKVSDPNDGGQILVLSVIGQQSSGKSLLLNTLFGAQFLSSAGRCTRGIYGCLIDIKSEDQGSRFKKILLLDSEGIQSTEQTDDNFDKRIVFYILCVSHIVLICSKADMNKQMEELIKIATDAISQLKDQISKQPQVNIIMNNVTVINRQALADTIRILSNAILQIKNRDNNVQQLFTIDENNVIMLPNAFAMSGTGNMVVNQPSFNFAQKTDLIRNKIFDFILKSDSRETSNYNQAEWFKFAQSFWKFTDEFEGITEYSSLEERKQGMLLHDTIKQIIQTNFEDPVMKAKHEKEVSDKAQSIFNKHLGYYQTSVKVIQQQIDDELIQYYDQVKNEIINKFRKFCDDKQIQVQIKTKRVDQLLTQIQQHIFSWNSIIQDLFVKFNDKKSQFIGDKSLQNMIEIHTQNNDKTYSLKESIELFEQDWDLIQNEMENTFKKKTEIQDESIYAVQQIYLPNIKGVIDKGQQKLEYLEYNKYQQNSIKKLFKEKDSFFYYTGKKERPNAQKYLDQVGQEKEYIFNYEIYDNIKATEYFDWLQVVKERFNFFALQREISYYFTKEEYSSKRGYFIIKPMNNREVENMCQTINKEGEYLSIQLTEDFTGFLINFENNYIIPHLTKINSNYKYYMQLYQQKNEINRLIDDFIKHVKNNLMLYFKFKKSSIKNNQQYQDLKFFWFSHTRTFPEQAYKSAQVYNQSQYIIQKISLSKEEAEKNGLQFINSQKSYLQVKDWIKNQHQYFALYLQYLAYPDNIQMPENSEAVNQSKIFFQKSMADDKIIQKINEIVLKNIFKESQNEHQNVDSLIAQLQASKDISITQKLLSLDYKIIQRIVSDIELIIQKIEEEMEPFCFKVSEKGSSFLHSVAQIYIVSIIAETRWLIEQAPLLNLLKGKNVQKELYIAKLTCNDNTMDIKLAERTAGNVADMIHGVLKTKQIDNFKYVISQEMEKFNLKNIIKAIENYLISVADQNDQSNPFLQIKTSVLQKFQNFIGMKPNEPEEEKLEMPKNVLISSYGLRAKDIIKFYVKPGQFFEKTFEKQWQKTTKKQLAQQIEDFDRARKNTAQQFSQYFKQLKEQINKNKMKTATDLFIPEHSQSQGGTPDGKQFKNLCQKALAKYLVLLLEQKWNQSQKIIIENNGQSYTMIANTNVTLVHHKDISTALDPEFIQGIKNHIENETVSNLETFIEQFMKNVSKKLSEDDVLKDVDLIGEYYQELRTKTQGCEQMCPLCRRKCDVHHENELVQERVHKCEEGHQIQGFGGNRHRVTNESIPFGCHEFDKNDSVFYQNKEKSWDTFKADIMVERKWDLNNEDDVALLHLKKTNVKIWNLIGPHICQYYQEKEGIAINFLKADINRPKGGAGIEKTLYIMILDSSGSMGLKELNGQTRWDNLKVGVSGFLSTLSSNHLLMNNSKVSMIIYSSRDMPIPTEPKMPSVSLVNDINPFGDGNTNFHLPFQAAYKFIKSNIQNYQRFTVYFLSDGEAYYPEEAIQQFKSDSALMEKMNFMTLAYGGADADSENLKKIATQLNGKFENVLKPNMLSNAFIQLIPNIYGEKPVVEKQADA